MPKVSVFLPSYNKGKYVLDAMRSVLAQTYQSWELFIIENSNDETTFSAVVDEIMRWESNSLIPQDCEIHIERLEGEEIEKQRKEKYMTAWLLNVYYPEAKGDYIFYLSDDDIIDPNCFELMAGELDANDNYYVVYAGLRMVGVSAPGQNGPFPNTGIPAQDSKSFPGSVDQRIDGGQILHRKSCLDALVPPYFEESGDGVVARHCDGIFLERLVGRYVFWPIDRYLITHRWTTKSLWSKAYPDGTS